MPPLKKTLALFAVLGVVYSGILFGLVDTLLIDTINVLSVPLFALMLFMVPGIIASELYHVFLSHMTNLVLMDSSSRKKKTGSARMQIFYRKKALPENESLMF